MLEVRHASDTLGTVIEDGATDNIVLGIKYGDAEEGSLE